MRNLADRFWEKVCKQPDGCWVWTASKTPKGYGQMSAGRRGCRPVTAHRVSWQLHFGAIPNGKMVLHRCDNPACVNPAHLFLGTNDDNMQDRDAKDRVAHGDTHCNAKLTAEKVKIIRALYARGESPAALAQRFGCSAWNIVHVVRRDTWKRVV